MANDVMTVTGVGRLVKDVEIGYTNGGMAIAKGTIAVNRSRKRDNERVEEASFFDIEIFGKTAENLKPYLVKGQQIAIKGYPKQDRWEKDGQKFSRVKFGVEEIQLVGGHRDSQQAPNYDQQQPASNGYGSYGSYPNYGF